MTDARPPAAPVPSPGSAPSVDHAPGIVIDRVVEWSDTDASGYIHNSLANRLFESAEAEFLRCHGILGLLTQMPRVRLEFTFRSRLAFGDRVRVHAYPNRIGRTSLTWSMRASGPDGALAIEGQITVVHAPGSSSQPWPDDIRAIWEGSCPPDDPPSVGQPATVHGDARASDVGGGR